jgi:hypothetical protein
LSQPILQQAGGQPQKQPRFASIHQSDFRTGLFTNRCPFHDPSQFVVARFYGGKPDALLDGSNIELSNRLTWRRRGGLSPFGTATYAAAPDNAYSYTNPDGTVSVFVDTVTGVYQHNGSTATLIWTKSAGAGQTTFLRRGNVLYFANGVDNKKLANGTVWNWGIGGPALAPTLNIVESGSAAVTWALNTVFSTMGLLVDSHGNVQELVSVNADGSNPNGTIGTTGNGTPTWSPNPGTTSSDGSLTWTNYGPIVAWTAHTTYSNATGGGTLANPCIIYDPVSKSCYIVGNAGGASGTSGSTKPNFTGGFASQFFDGSVKWFCLGSPTTPGLWKPSTSYPALGSVSDNDSVSGISEPVTPATAGIGGASPQQIFWQISQGGTSSAGGTTPPWSTATGTLTNDNQLSWLCLGSATPTTNANVSAWAGAGSVFSCVKDPNGNLQVCIVTGRTGATLPGVGANPAWGLKYGQNTPDGTATWVCVGNSLSWATNTKWYLPLSGYIPPQSTSPYGGASVIDSNSNVQFVIKSGKSGAVAPTWSSSTGTTTVDSGITWLNTNAYNQSSFSWTAGYGYCYAFKSRMTDDFFISNIPNGLLSPLGIPTGSTTGGVSTASPIFKMTTGPNAGAVVTVQGVGSLDPQVDTIVIFRCADGFQGGPYLELTEIPAPPPVNGKAAPWTFQDSVTDINLNPLITADVVGLNDPPPVGLNYIASHLGRIWGGVGADVYCSSGKDIIVDNGNGDEGWAGANVFPLQSPVIKLVPNQNGLITFTTSDIYSITGGPSVLQFFADIMVPGVGLLSTNALVQLGGEIYFFSADKRLISLMPGVGDSHIGFPIADRLQMFNPANVYLTLHENGDDAAIYLADGSTGYYRLNPHQAPDNEATWSPFATITGGCKMVLSVLTAPGVKSLLFGSTTTGQPLLQRDLTVNTDNGTAFACYGVIGAIVAAHPGQWAELNFVTVELNRVGSAPTMSFLQMETTGTFTAFATYVSDPPILYGTTITPTSIFANRYYFKQTMAASAATPPVFTRNLQIRFDYPAENATNELYNFAVFGALWQEQ